MPLWRYYTIGFGGLELFKICQVLLGLKSYPVELSADRVKRAKGGNIQYKSAAPPHSPLEGAFGRNPVYPGLGELLSPNLGLQKGQGEFGQCLHGFIPPFWGSSSFTLVRSRRH